MTPHRTTTSTLAIGCLVCACLLDVVFYSLAVAQAAPPINQCRKNWVLSEITPLDFGAFSIEAGSGTISMNSFGALTTTGAINLFTSQPVTAFVVSADNTLSSACATYGFDLDWQRAPGPLKGRGADIPQTNILVSIPAYGLSDVSLPQTIAAGAGNTLPFTITIYSTISPTAPQTSDTYQSGNHTLELQQSNGRARLTSRTSATVFAPLAIVEQAVMNFGTLAGGQTPGTVVLDTAGGRSFTGGAQILAAGPGASATFQLTGEPNLSYTLSFTDGVLSDGGGQQMTLTNFTHTASGIMPAAGTDTFQVGASLNVDAIQPAGAYSTSNAGGTPYTVTISYN
jgi:hypothetical protein